MTDFRGTTMLAWCPRLNAPATFCHHDGCTHYLIPKPENARV